MFSTHSPQAGFACRASSIARSPSIILSLLIVLMSAPFSHALEDWPQFRGPGGDGVAQVGSVPLKWSESEQVAWKQPLPGRAWSSPVVAEETIWLTTAIEELPQDDEREALLAAKGNEPRKFKQLQIAKRIRLNLLACELDSGKLSSNTELIVVGNPDAIHALNSYASPTPVIDGDRIYCHFGTFGTVCLKRGDLSVVWKKVLPLEHGVGPGSSPFVHKDMLVLLCDGVDRQYVTALNKFNGEEIWKTDRPEMDAPLGDQKKAYSTPIALVDKAGREQLICMGSQWLVSYEPTSGDEIWRFDHGKGFSVVPRPVEQDGVVYVSTGYVKPELVAVRIDGSGELKDDQVVWRNSKNVPAKPSPLLIEDRLFVIDDKGIVSCFAAKDGRLIYRERIDGSYSASPLLAQGRIYLCSQEGATTVLSAGDKFERLAENRIDGEIMASPIAVDNSLIIRSDTALYRIADGGK